MRQVAKRKQQEGGLTSQTGTRGWTYRQRRWAFHPGNLGKLPAVPALWIPEPFRRSGFRTLWIPCAWIDMQTGGSAGGAERGGPL
jgi:hypothetical protein